MPRVTVTADAVGEPLLLDERVQASI